MNRGPAGYEPAALTGLSYGPRICPGFRRDLRISQSELLRPEALRAPSDEFSLG